MKLKNILSAALALGMVISSISVTGVYAAEPTFLVGTPIDISTGKEVTEFTAGQVIEVPIDVTNIDSGALTMMQFRIYYDNNIFTAGGSQVNDDVYYTYVEYDSNYASNNYSSYAGIDQNDIVVGRHNMKTTNARGNYVAAGKLTGNSTANAEYMNLLWNVTTSATPIAVNDDEAEIYALFTVTDDYDPEDYNLNYTGTNSYATDQSTSSGLFTLNALYVDETTTTNHSNLSGTQYDGKINSCDGAFQIVVDSSKLTYWVQSVTATIGETEYALDACLNENGSTTYTFPVRITSTKGDSSVDVVISALVTDDEAGEVNPTTVSWGTVTVSDMTGTVTDYTSVSAEQ